MSLAIFIYGSVVFALVCVALGLIALGIVSEHRDRTRPERGRQVYGDAGAELELATRN